MTCATKPPASEASAISASATAALVEVGGPPSASVATSDPLTATETSAARASSYVRPPARSCGWSFESFDGGFRVGRSAVLEQGDGDLHIVLTARGNGPVRFDVPAEVVRFLETGEQP
jgi:hypothetical protein